MLVCDNESEAELATLCRDRGESGRGEGVGLVSQHDERTSGRALERGRPESGEVQQSRHPRTDEAKPAAVEIKQDDPAFVHRGARVK